MLDPLTPLNTGGDDTLGIGVEAFFGLNRDVAVVDFSLPPLSDRGMPAPPTSIVLTEACRDKSFASRISTNAQ